MGPAVFYDHGVKSVFFVFFCCCFVLEVVRVKPICHLCHIVFFAATGNHTGLLGCVASILNQNEVAIVAHNLIGINRQ